MQAEPADGRADSDRRSVPTCAPAPICPISATRALRAPTTGALDVRAALEARRRLGLEAEVSAGLPHRRGLEIGALEHDGGRRRPDLRRRAAHDAGDRLRAGPVGDHEHLGIELPLDAVQRRDQLAAFRAPDPQLRARELREVERVHRLAQFDQDVVGDVDDRADRSDAGGLQARRHPLRRHGARRQIGHRRARSAGTARVLDRAPCSVGRRRRSSSAVAPDLAPPGDGTQ